MAPTDDVDLPLVFRGADAVRDGVLTSRQLRDGPWVRLLRGTYTRRDVEVTHPLLCRAAGLLLPPSAMLTGASAAAVLVGATWLRARDDVQVVVPSTAARPTVKGVVARRSSAALVGGRRWETTTIAEPARVAFDAAARVPLAAGVGRLDALVRSGFVDVDHLTGWLDGRHDGDVVAVRAALALVDPRAESLPESAVRVELVLAGFDVVPQFVVRTGRGTARVDLALPDLRIAVEYDGAWHQLAEQRAKDRERAERLREAGWIVVHVSAEHLRTPGVVTTMVRAAVARR